MSDTPRINLPSNLPISIKVWLAHDEYEYIDDPKVISCTALLNSTKQLILGQRVPPGQGRIDVNTLVSNHIGRSIHNNIEETWTKHYAKGMAANGIPQKVIDRIRINPSKAELTADPTIIPAYMEIRSQREIDGYTITGQFDFCIEGRVEDFKSTSTYSYTHGTGNDKYPQQGSIYRWLNPDIITQDRMAIQYIFIDWKIANVVQDPMYPKSRTLEVTYPLMTLTETENFIRDKLRAYTKYKDADESLMPPCTGDDLWIKPSTWKYYKNPAKTLKSTKNFTNPDEANLRLAKDGYVGIVKEVKGKVIRCKYCPALNICKQKDEYILDGSLNL